MTIRRATEADLAAIAAIQRCSPEAGSWAPLDYPAYVAVQQGGVAGFIVTRETAPGECEILNLAIAPACRRQGIGKRLVEHVIQSTQARWFLEVRESNVAAIALYNLLGFKPVGRRENYYNEPPEAAIVMSFFS